MSSGGSSNGEFGDTGASNTMLGRDLNGGGPAIVVIVTAIFLLLALTLNDRSPIWIWITRRCCGEKRWPIHFISNRYDHLPRHEPPQTYFGLDVLDPNHLVESYCLPTWGILFLHVVCFIYFIVYVLLDVCLYYPEPGGQENPYWQWLTYLTNWSIMFYALSCFVAAVNTLRHLIKEHRPNLQRNKAKPEPRPTVLPATVALTNGGVSYPPPVIAQHPASPHVYEEDYVQERWDFLSVAHLLLMETFTTAAFFVGVWYWVGIVAIVGSDSQLNQATTYMPHGGSAILAALQIILTRLPIVSNLYIIILCCAVLYMLFLWIYGSCTGVWRYGLEWYYARPVGVFILVPVILFVMFFIWYWVARIRELGVCGARKVRRRAASGKDTGRNGQHPAGPEDLEMQPPQPMQAPAHGNMAYNPAT